MKHFMHLSELYGRIGQLLREHGDAPIGEVKHPMSKPPYMAEDYISPVYCSFTHVTTEVSHRVKLSTYQITINSE